jgi:ubiquinone/menaquinone biosynthesis C-methylase UbiE
MSQPQASDTLREWTESAPYWERHGATIRVIFAPVTRAFIENTGIVSGQSVLDVAGGPGEPSLTIAEKVGPTGSVMCTDAVAEMVEAARREAHRRGITNVSFRKCMADALPFGDNSFDVVISRLGVMFFPDPVAALREMLRVTKPGGGLALAVWQKSEHNPFLHVVTEVMSRYVETAPADPDAPGAFRFAEPSKLARILTEAGAIQVRERFFSFHIEAPISPDEFWELRSATSATLREKLTSLPEEKLNQVRQEVKEAARRFFPNGHMSFPAKMIIVSARKS